MMIHQHRAMPDFTSQKYRFHYLTALNLLEGLGVPLHNIYLRCLGVYENYRGQIRAQEPPAGTELTGDTVITLEVGCSSAVDFMPYQFFYGLKGLRDSDRTWEINARSLMAPFDAASLRYEAALRFHTLRYALGIVDAGYLARFLELFDYDPGEDPARVEDVLYMVAILPSLNEWGGNASVLEPILQRLFGYKAYINENIKNNTNIPDSLQYRVGAKTGRLGFETLVGRSFDEFDSAYELVLSDVPPEAVADLLPGGKSRRRIERFLEYCMPGELDCRFTIKVEKCAAGKAARKYLGYSTFV